MLLIILSDFMQLCVKKKSPIIYSMSSKFDRYLADLLIFNNV